MERIPIETWFFEVPIITRCYTCAAILTSLAVQCDLVTPYQLFFSWHTAYTKGQYWRFITAFLFFGQLSIDFLFHLFFMSRYSRMLEESYARRTVDFAWLMFLMGVALLLLSPFTSDPFLGSPLSFTLTYIWSRRNAAIEMSFLGLFIFPAAFLPLVLICFSLVVNGRVPAADIVGLVVGHVFYFLEDVWPQNPASGGRRWLACPTVIGRMLGQHEETLQDQQRAIPHVHVD